MKFYGRAQEIAHKLITAFEAGNIPAALATIYLKNKDKPMHQWSMLNQLGVAVMGCTDARGFQQWKKVGRKVTKGEKAHAAILVPLMGKKENDDGEFEKIIYGFKGVAVFDVSQTEGDPLPQEEASQKFIDELPLITVAESLGIEVDLYNGQGKGALGMYSKRGEKQRILLGVANANTWLHELIHAADDNLGNLTEHGQHWRSETVAQLGACILAKMLEQEDVADEGKTYAYIKRYAEADGQDVTAACIKVIERTCKAIDYIMSAYECAEYADEIYTLKAAVYA